MIYPGALIEEWPGVAHELREELVEQFPRSIPLEVFASMHQAYSSCLLTALVNDEGPLRPYE